MLLIQGFQLYYFTYRCLLEWLRHKNICPMCKAPVRKESSISRVVPVETTGLILAVTAPSSASTSNPPEQV